ncbi:hypothetical protein, partial [Paenibacillus lautus]|uniref:hypothetical protein n=1 Tax=Paenibacillus lautus TaxID=1401 RepID=UPI002DB8E164
MAISSSLSTTLSGQNHTETPAGINRGARPRKACRGGSPGSRRTRSMVLVATAEALHFSEQFPSTAYEEMC